MTAKEFIKDFKWHSKMKVGQVEIVTHFGKEYEVEKVSGNNENLFKIRRGNGEFRIDA